MLSCSSRFCHSTYRGFVFVAQLYFRAKEWMFVFACYYICFVFFLFILLHLTVNCFIFWSTNAQHYISKSILCCCCFTFVFVFMLAVCFLHLLLVSPVCLHSWDILFVIFAPPSSGCMYSVICVLSCVFFLMERSFPKGRAYDCA